MGPGPFKECDSPRQIGKLRLKLHGYWGLDPGRQLPAGPAGRSSGNTGDLSQCAGREGFLEVEELALEGEEEVGCQSWERSPSQSPAHTDPLPAYGSPSLGWPVRVSTAHSRRARLCLCDSLLGTSTLFLTLFLLTNGAIWKTGRQGQKRPRLGR